MEYYLLILVIAGVLALTAIATMLGVLWADRHQEPAKPTIKWPYWSPEDGVIDLEWPEEDSPEDTAWYDEMNQGIEAHRERQSND